MKQAPLHTATHPTHQNTHIHTPAENGTHHLIRASLCHLPQQPWMCVNLCQAAQGKVIYLC